MRGVTNKILAKGAAHLHGLRRHGTLLPGGEDRP